MVSVSDLQTAQKNTKNIRNICILAHVDHGKTTFSDHLISSNGIISENLAGEVRYMDSTSYEQEKKITMKSSSICLIHEMKKKKKKKEKYLINLIDSPGHVDFSDEVSTAARLSDGCIVLIDVIEGVCIQTRTVLRQAFKENIIPCLVFNKLDRLIEDVKMTPEEAYRHIYRQLQNVNIVMAGYMKSKRFKDLEKKGISDVSVNTDDINDYFSPQKGNVGFACSLDGWGFRIDDFATIFSKKLGFKKSVLMKTLWGEFYYNSKTKTLQKKPGKTSAKRPMFVDFVFANIWRIYKVVKNGKMKKIEKLISTLGINVERNLKSLSAQEKTKEILHEWLPLSKSLLKMVVQVLPNPIVGQRNRMLNLIPELRGIGNSSTTTTKKEKSLLEGNKASRIQMRNYRKKLKSALLQCHAGEDVPVLVFVSKMIEVDDIPIMMEIEKTTVEKRSGYVRGKFKQSKNNLQILSNNSEKPNEKKSENDNDSDDDSDDDDSDDDKMEEKKNYVGFARIFSGTLKVGQTVHILGPKYTAGNPKEHRKTIIVKDLFLLMGRGLKRVISVPAGNVFAIGNLAHFVYKTSTISSSSLSPIFTAMYNQTAPIMKVAVEPVDLKDLPKLVEGLRILNQTDPSVKVYVEKSGEHIIMSTGEIHIGRCLKELREKFAKVEFEVSPPLVNFRETIILEKGTKAISYECTTPDKSCSIKIKAIPMPFAVAQFIELNKEKIGAFVSQHVIDSELTNTEIIDEMKLEFKKVKWENHWKNVWSIGPKRRGPNILVNNLKEKESFSPFYENSKNIEMKNNEKTQKIRSIEKSIIAGFQLATEAGPMCDEPMMGVCFIIESIEFLQTGKQQKTTVKIGTFNGQIMGAIKDGCRYAFRQSEMRLVEPLYACDVQTNLTSIGKVYPVLNKRRYKVMDDAVESGTAVITIKGTLPVAESFGFAEELRTKTHGDANAQLMFSHWSILEIDPYFIPTTKDEMEEFGEDYKDENIAIDFIQATRKRKGLFVKEKVIESAEKQKTLKKK